jgi:hypothetical protein
MDEGITRDRLWYVLHIQIFGLYDEIQKAFKLSDEEASVIIRFANDQETKSFDFIMKASPIITKMLDEMKIDPLATIPVLLTDWKKHASTAWCTEAFTTFENWYKELIQ